MSQTSEQLNSRLEANRAEVVPNADGVKSGSSQTDCESQASIEELMKHAGLEPSLENATAIYALTDVPNYLLQGLNFEGRPVYRFAKRTFDVAASAVGMCLLSWLILGTAIAVKATSPGPIIFKQQRVGKNKKLFNIYKFRTMRIDTPNLPSHMIDANDWLTPIGAIMRRFSLDELPQLWNIFKGDIPLRILKTRPEFSEESMGAFALPAKSSTNKGKVFSQVVSCFASGLRMHRISGFNCKRVGSMGGQFLAKPVFKAVCA